MSKEPILVRDVDEISEELKSIILDRGFNVKELEEIKETMENCRFDFLKEENKRVIGEIDFILKSEEERKNNPYPNSPF